MGVGAAGDAEVWACILAEVAAGPAADTLEVLLILGVHCRAERALSVALCRVGILEIVRAVAGQAGVCCVHARLARSLTLLADSVDVCVAEGTLCDAPVAHQDWQSASPVAVSAVALGPEALCTRCLTPAASQLGFLVAFLEARGHEEPLVALGQARWLANKLVGMVLAAEEAPIPVARRAGLAASFA